jgi:hypothetical protein
MPLNSSEINFIGRGFRILDILESGDDVAICEIENSGFVLLSGDELVEHIIILLDEYHD